MIKAIPVGNNGNLELLNTPKSREEILVKRLVLYATLGADAGLPILIEKKIPSGSKYLVNLSEKLVGHLGTNHRGHIAIRLDLEPEPADQPGMGKYWVEIVDGKIELMDFIAS